MESRRPAAHTMLGSPHYSTDMRVCWHFIRPRCRYREAEWSCPVANLPSLCGQNSAAPVRRTRLVFCRGLLEKDNGKLMAWFFALSQLDTPHQHFFTRSEKRTAAFYDAFSTSGDIRTGASTLMRRGTFSEFLREIPLDGENVDFPRLPGNLDGGARPLRCQPANRPAFAEGAQDGSTRCRG